MAVATGRIASVAGGEGQSRSRSFRSSSRRSSCGTLIEWYDFYLYGVLATFFADQFFPGDMRNGFLFSLGIFWTGFHRAPVRRDLFGHLGDLIGRKYTFC